MVGFLLAGVGNVDLRRKTNNIIVDSSMLLNYYYLKSLLFKYGLYQTLATFYSCFLTVYSLSNAAAH